ncbi:MAG: hypothetical protein ACRD1O_09095 [Terriglobia bacterium]
MPALAQFALFITWFQMLTPGFRVGARALGKRYTEGIFKSRMLDGYDDVNLCVWKEEEGISCGIDSSKAQFLKDKELTLRATSFRRWKFVMVFGTLVVWVARTRGRSFLPGL